MSVLRATPKAKDLPRPDRGQQGSGSFTEVEVPADYSVVFTGYDDYDKTAQGKTKGWIFHFLCEYAPNRSVVFDVYLAHTDDGLWKINEVFDSLGSPSQDGVERDYNPDAVIGTECGAHIDFPRDKTTNEPTSSYREIRWTFPLPEDSDIQALVPDAAPLSSEPESGLENQTAEEPTTL